MSEVQVYKNNSLINAKSTWGVQEQKLFSVLLSDLNDKKEKEFNLTKRELEEILCKGLKEKDMEMGEGGISHINVTHIRKLSKSLVKKGFSVNISEDEWEDIQLFEKISYRKGVMTICLTNTAMPYLYELKNYTRYMLDDILNLKNKYSIRIFEMLKKETFKQRKSFKISVKELKDFIGVGEDEYIRFNDFNRFVLEKAEKEINENTKLKFRYEKIKSWRTITDIEFFYISNEIMNIPNSINFREFSHSQKEKLMTLGVNKTIEINNRNDWSTTAEEYIIAQAEKTKNSKPENIYGFLVRCIEEDWAGIEELKNLEFNQISINEIRTEKKKPKNQPTRGKKNNKDFTEREYDYDDLELKLLGWDKL